MLEIHQIPVLNDNYVYLAHDNQSGQTAVVDPALAGPVMQVLQNKGWTLTHILNTHHHWDHVGGNLELKISTGCIVVGARADRNRIPGIDIEVSEGDDFQLGEARAEVLEVPGHTRAHIAYWFAESNALFCGDTLFAMGCGRLFEGTAEQMWHSLSKFKSLPGSARVYCAHEYTQTNGRFALTVEPNSAALQERMREVDRLRQENLPTIPSTLEQERATNPFLRSDDAEIQKNLGLEGMRPTDVFAEIRRRKDDF